MSTDLDPVGLVDPIAVAVQACPAVAGLHGGRFGRSTTYLPGRRIAGVAILPGEIIIGVVGRYPVSVSEIATQVRSAVATVVPDVPVTVHLEDVMLPGEDRTGPASDAPPGVSEPSGAMNVPPTPTTPAGGPRPPESAPIPTAASPTSAPLAMPISQPLEKEHSS